MTAAGIEEIYIVRGYYGEQFDALLYKYPNIKFIENPMYSEANNISSLMAARYLLQGSYVIESDLLLSNPALIKKYQYHSNYLAIPMERSDDWCFDVNKKGVIERVRVGGDGGVWQMVGISYWTPEDGRKLVGGHREDHLDAGRQGALLGRGGAHVLRRALRGPRARVQRRRHRGD